MPIVMKKAKGTYGYRTVAYRHIDGATMNALITGSAAMGVPTAPTVTPQGAAGAVTYGYRVTAVSGAGETTGSTEGTTATGNATLDGTNFNRITWAAVAGAARYNIYRTTGGGTQGKIGSTAGDATRQFDDTGLAASGAVPGSNTAVTYNIFVPSLKPAGAGAAVKTGIGVNASRSATGVIIGGR